jgi:hypothetical protein
MDYTDTDIDYDKIIENLNNSDLNNNNNNNNIKKILENVEEDIKKNNKKDILDDKCINNDNHNTNIYSSNLFNYEYKDIIILVLLFILINNEFIIDMINKNVSIIYSYTFPNLIIRSLIFGIILLILKKYKLL